MGVSETIEEEIDRVDVLDGNGMWQRDDPHGMKIMCGTHFSNGKQATVRATRHSMRSLSRLVRTPATYSVVVY